MDGGAVVDPRTGDVAEKRSILISGGRIVAVESVGDAATDTSTQRIDIAGKFVTPGYNDMHSHVLELDDPSGALALLLSEGVTGVRQMSGSHALLSARRAGGMTFGDFAPAVLEMPGEVLTPLNAATTDQVKTEITAQHVNGADFIKVGFLAPPVFEVAMREAKRVGLRILGHLQDGVDAAGSAREGFHSIEHLGPGATIWIACSTEEESLKSDAKPVRIKAPPAGVPFLKDLISWRVQTMLINPSAFVPPEYAARLQRAFQSFDEGKADALCGLFNEQGTWHVPTLVRLRTQELADAPEYATHDYLRYMPAWKIKRWRGVTKKFSKLPAPMRQAFAAAYPKQLMLTKFLSDKGVRMLTGSDGGWLSAPGLTLQEEFIELAKAGLSPLKILQMTTINAAEYLRRTDAMGAVEPGRNADLVLLDANPLERVENLGRIAGVVRNGRHFSRRDLDALKDRVAMGRGYLNGATP
ncbi:MAG: amidohydrolase family protein [Hyphomonadaceae bacterium]